ncbi:MULTISPECIES: hypothetical protein [unclassified Ruegeria]|uniref:hypothetical protein n=1 Tax=unclassified Ruegeria TaxID=2625375 RepID=UPI001489EDB0|nr:MULTISPECIES: hypothetical protein [unclassified Ruegeria]NOD76471.1 hypothetical protein [Ruegeria sp. HKCCD4332]NOD89191.1 hypothetical protein [Ruegeria sp. HKCCD4318]NOE13646.1 hypothetical protein [Ruegeria sp. HKCCD4318-2]NOG07603.1 hypothetical protein [Ruegeria sp. HKCCD4315]
MSQVVIAVSVAAGVWVAYRQLHSWKGEKLSSKRAELGEELISHASELIGKFQTIRSPLGFGAPEGEEDDGAYDFRRRLKELAELDDDFAELRRLGVRQKALIGDQEVRDAIDVIFDARVKLIVALRAKIREAKRDSTRFGRELSEKDLQRIETYEDVIWDGYDRTSGSITERLSGALNAIETKLLPFIRHFGSS